MLGLSKEQIGGLVRTGLAVLAGVLASYGFGTLDMWTLLLSSALVLGTAGWSLVQKYLTAKALGDGSEVQVAADAVAAALAVLAAAAERAAALDKLAKSAVSASVDAAVAVAAPASVVEAPPSVEPASG